MPSDILKSIWPEWRIVGALGRGSYGVVYEAVRTDFSVESRAAIKVISVPQSDEELDSLRSDGMSEAQTRTYLRQLVDDFVREIELMKTLQGAQNVVIIEDYKVIESPDEIHWDIYVRMELLASLKSYAGRKPFGRLTQGEVIQLGCDICKALEACERANIIHRDIKPDNILVHEMFGIFKLADFGVAKRLEGLTANLSVKGTPNYMAPEVFNRQKYDRRADLYSLGLVLYQYMNRTRLPFVDLERQVLTPEERKQALGRRLRGEALPAPVDASEALAGVILRACAFDPSARYGSAREMREALERVADGMKKPRGSTPPAAPAAPRDPEDGDTVFVNRERRVPSGAEDGGTVAVKPAKPERREAKGGNRKPPRDDADERGVSDGKGKNRSGRGLRAVAIALAALLVIGIGALVGLGGRKPEPLPEWRYKLAGNACTIVRYNGSDEAVVIPDSFDGAAVTAIGDLAFSGNARMRSVVIPEGVTSIGYGAFANCAGLTSVSVPASVVSIGNNAFANCAGLTAFTLQEGLESIGAAAFAHCEGLASFVIPEGVTSVGAYAFAYCVNLAELTIPLSMASIGSNLILRCDRLAVINYPGNPWEWGRMSIAPYNEHLTGEAEESEASEEAFAWLYESVGGEIVISGCVGRAEAVTIPAAIGGEPVVTVGENAFAGNQTLLSVVIPDGVRSVGKGAFSGCVNLESISVPASVTELGESAFAYCTRLTRVELACDVNALAAGAFYGCSDLAEIALPQGVAGIGENAFACCLSLKTVSLPAGLERVERNAFYGCSSLSEVDYAGSGNRWKKVDIAAGNDALSEAEISYGGK